MRPLCVIATIAAVLGSAQALGAPPTPPGDLRATVDSGTAIDFDGERSAPAALSMLGGDRDGSMGAGGAPPTPPASLRATVYSSTALEVFWDRDNAQRLSYAVAIDGATVTTTNGISYFTGALRPGRTYQIDVVAVGTDGQRSGAASIEVKTNEAAGGGDTARPDPLAAPSNLRQNVYSETAAELFWNRADMPGLRYEITRDGARIATTDGTSYYDALLTAGREFRYSVIAIDAAGIRSSATAIALRTPGASASIPVSPPPSTSPAAADTTPLYPETSGTPSPKDITLAVYSDTTAELNWTRPFYSDGIEANEILRDGELIATIPGGGNSYVDDTRTPGCGYRYEIVAINRFGRASSVFIDVGVGAGGPVGPGEPLDASGLPAELAALLDTSFDLLGATPFEKVAATIFGLDDPVARGLRLVSTEPARFVEGSDRLGYACPQGGSWFDTAWNDEEEHHDIEAVACAIGPVTLSGRGQLRTGTLDNGVTSRRSVLFSNVTLLDSRDDSRIEMQYSYSAFDQSETSGFVRGDMMSITRLGETYAADTFRLVATTDEPESIVLNGENVDGALAGAARIRSRETLLVGDNGYPASGAVAIVQLGSNNESYDIAADNGNPATFTFTATISGVTTAYEIPWSTTRDIGGLDPSSVDVGF